MKDDFINREEIERWFSDYIARLRNESIVGLQRQEMMNLVNPKYVLRNHLAQIAIEKAQNKDFSEVEKLLNILSKPYAEQSEYESYATSPPDNFPSVEVSCSS
ncbi:protein adenylyltransferase SelO family protein [Polynucleobacter necessarius]|uniref:protein adenylyltransferase SelO family protein n=1 Tax=Polynucleobacter necessarius TaxID=576610 RepID=UPI001E48C3D2|nr:protein adenylyltransferase SelO family protein [Polynucleobacter necessarius]